MNTGFKSLPLIILGTIFIYGCGGGGINNPPSHVEVADNSGRIVMAASTKKSGADYDLMLSRYTQDGDADTSFGADYDGNGMPDGYVRFQHPLLNGSDEIVTDVIVDSQDRIVVAGSSNAGGNHDVVVWRFTSDGNPDTGFGEDYDADGNQDGFVLNYGITTLKAGGEQEEYLTAQRKAGGEQEEYLTAQRKAGGEQMEYLIVQRKAGGEQEEYLTAQRKAGGEQMEYLIVQRKAGGEQEEYLAAQRKAGGEQMEY